MHPGGSVPASDEAAGKFFTWWSEKIPGHGEDASPVAQSTGEDRGAVAVFDGLGGAGSAKIGTDVGEQSQARIAASVASKAVTDFLAANPPPVDAGGRAAEQLGEWLCRELGAAMESLGVGASKVRSKLIRTLPTTLALGRFAPAPGGGVRYEAIWAGDSRVYLFTPSHGLQLLSEDDIRIAGDALANLSQDSPLSNMVCASAPFFLNTRTVELDERPAILFAATDGCFGYVPTPWHFENLLLTALRGSSDYAGWYAAIQVEIQKVTQDDTSMAMAIIGAASFEELKRHYGWRAYEIGELVRWQQQQDSELALTRYKVSELEDRSVRTRHEVWTKYRTGFEHWILTQAKQSTASMTVAVRAAGRAATGKPSELVAAAGPGVRFVGETAPARPATTEAVDQPAGAERPHEHVCTECGERYSHHRETSA